MKAIALKHLIIVLVSLVTLADLHAQWREVVVPAPFNGGYYLDVFFLPSNPDLGWACSMEGHVVRTTDGGKTWRGNTIPGAFLEYVQFLNPTTGFVSGQGGVFRSDDGGATWRDITPTPMVQDKGWGSFWLNDRVGLYFVGGCINGTQAFYRTSDGGRNWTVFFGNEPNSGLSDGLLYADGTGWAVSSGILWRTLDFGRTWTKFSNTGPKYWTEEISVAGRSILLPTSGLDCDGQTRKVGSLRYSRDGGVSWKEYQTGKNMFGTFLHSETVGWGVGDDRTVLYTDNGGQQWTLRNCGIRGNIDDIYFINDTLGWAVGQGIYRSNFNASNSSIKIVPSEPVLYICPGDSVFVEAFGPFGIYRWSDNVEANARILRDTGTYIVRAYDSIACAFVADTIRLAARSSFKPVITASKREMCEGDTATLTVNGPIAKILWSTGDTTRSIVVNSRGPFSCTVTDSAGCTVTIPATSLRVNPNPRPVITASRNLVMCLDDTVTLATTQRYASYKWSTQQTASSITVTQSGVYTVSVVDSNGCVGQSDTVRVSVLNTRNKAEFLLDAGSSEVVIEDHAVGELRCRDIRIRNRSADENLVISDAQLAGNVFFSLPQSQFPIVIAPLETSALRVCASAQDLGIFRDTLYMRDTCSVLGLPLLTRGTAIELAGSSRCDVDVQTTIYRAGSAWLLRAPFPLPASKSVTVIVRPPQGYGQSLRCSLYDSQGILYVSTSVAVSGVQAEISLPIENAYTGMYVLLIEDSDGILASYPVLVVQ
ncbi:MAG: hypothetical protein FJ211_01340 [Ignavibacteria bacterium]|nr:hypothetical protein [Ignavibacteria bacterium]